MASPAWLEEASRAPWQLGLLRVRDRCLVFGNQPQKSSASTAIYGQLGNPKGQPRIQAGTVTDLISLPDTSVKDFAFLNPCTDLFNF